MKTKMKKFTTEEIRDLFNLVMTEGMSFSEMVEVINQMVSDAEKHIFKEGDFLHSDWGDENITIIFKNQEGDKIYYHASKSCYFDVAVNDNRFWRNDGDFRPATEAEKQELLDALVKDGKRWNADKKCIEDIPKYKFKPGDKVRIKDGISSQTHHNIYPYFDDYYDKFLGKTLTVSGYTFGKFVTVEESICTFSEDWFEPANDLKIGDWVIAWDIVGEEVIAKLENIYGSDHKYLVAHTWYMNAVKWDSTQEQLEKLRKS